MLRYILFSIFLNASTIGHGQLFRQYFDGADTLSQNAWMLSLDPEDSTWVVGEPEKLLFDTAYTLPNALLTRASDPYPPGDTAIAELSMTMEYPNPFGILAMQWMQKLDYEPGVDGGTMEYSLDSGIEWHNCFTDPYVYAFYGFEPANVSELAPGMPGFTGTDTTWRNIWFCLDLSWAWALEANEIRIRFIHMADTVHSGHEGWMIDNVFSSVTIVHTIGEIAQKDHVKVTPSLTQGPVRVDVRKEEGFHIIESIHVYDNGGRLVQQHGLSPTRYNLDLGKLPSGTYHLVVRTNLETSSTPVHVQH